MATLETTPPHTSVLQQSFPTNSRFGKAKLDTGMSSKIQSTEGSEG